ncbi:hypothetical protein SAMN05720766_106105 [Fibrobacter sp. UWH9]|uniref:hypothetical protein n=1 Tax=unclassified Fibrobacter TaxID=2634177 RepID=UPI00091A83F7|nr:MULTISPECIES: hypothetical protein [unclassified Fibrobacter]MDO4945977.1 hypothetical protein [Fibrobacter sp.]OWV17437.1 hypothetical protein B7992_00810 [Fibrobacter sp. UWH1]SHH04628.1 hypothetical protein SAMN05720766_106105 [Fibrobacter sp. UWH9]
MKKIFLLLALAVSMALSQTPADLVQNPTDVAFSKAYLAIEGGEVYPWGSLADAVQNTYYAGISFRYTYWDNVDGIVMFNYSYFKPRPDDISFDGAHQFTGRLGLDWKWSKIRPIVLGAGFACNWVRADLDDGVDKDELYRKPGGTLGDNETEFGWYGRFSVPLWKYQKFNVGLNVIYEEIWTLPRRSDVLTVGIYVERSLW